MVRLDLEPVVVGEVDAESLAHPEQITVYRVAQDLVPPLQPPRLVPVAVRFVRPVRPNDAGEVRRDLLRRDLPSVPSGVEGEVECEERQRRHERERGEQPDLTCRRRTQVEHETDRREPGDSSTSRPQQDEAEADEPDDPLQVVRTSLAWS